MDLTAAVSPLFFFPSRLHLGRKCVLFFYARIFIYSIFSSLVFVFSSFSSSGLKELPGPYLPFFSPFGDRTFFFLFLRFFPFA